MQQCECTYFLPFQFNGAARKAQADRPYSCERSTKDDEMKLRENKMAELHGLRILISGHDDGDDLVGVVLRILFVLLSRSHII